MAWCTADDQGGGGGGRRGRSGAELTGGQVCPDAIFVRARLRMQQPPLGLGAAIWPSFSESSELDLRS